MRIHRVTPILCLVAAAALGAQPAARRDSGGGIAVDRIVAVVGDQPITYSNLLEEVNQRRAAGEQIPTDSTGMMEAARRILNEMIDEEVLLQQARRDTAITVDDADVQATVEQRMKALRAQFKTDAELTEALKGGGFGNIEEYRRWLADQARRRALVQRLVQKMRQEGKVVAMAVTDEEVTKAFNEVKGRLPRRPPTVTFRQIIVAPRASAAERSRALAKAESLLTEIRRGGDFEQIAKRESMDSSTRELGGDLGWNRRGPFYPEFERMMFALAPGAVSPVVETPLGFHIIRVDRVRPAEVKARQILIRARIDSASLREAQLRADSVLTLWRAGTSVDSLTAKYHDPVEEKGILQPFDRAQLPESYQKGFEGKGTGDFAGPFALADRERSASKFVVAQLLTANEGGEFTLADYRTLVRDQLAEERAMRRLLDTLRRETYVAVLL